MQNHAARLQVLNTRILALLLGGAIIVLALVTPMDLFGMGSMFTVHMAQHLLLSLAGPPLLILGIPAGRCRDFFSRHPIIARGFGVLIIPFVASVLFNANLWIWHAPQIFQAMMLSNGLHIFANLLYIVTGLLFWWPLFNPLQEEKPTLSLGGKLAYLFFSDMPMMLLGAGLTFTPPLYSFMMSHPTMQMHVTAMDQQLGGLLMWIVGTIFFIVLSSIFFLRWMLRQEKAQQEKEFEQDDDEEFEQDNDALERQHISLASNGPSKDFLVKH